LTSTHLLLSEGANVGATVGITVGAFVEQSGLQVPGQVSLTETPVNLSLRSQRRMVLRFATHAQVNLSKVFKKKVSSSEQPALVGTELGEIETLGAELGTLLGCSLGGRTNNATIPVFASTALAREPSATAASASEETTSGFTPEDGGAVMTIRILIQLFPVVSIPISGFATKAQSAICDELSTTTSAGIRRRRPLKIASTKPSSSSCISVPGSVTAPILNSLFGVSLGEKVGERLGESLAEGRADWPKIVGTLLREGEVVGVADWVMLGVTDGAVLGVVLANGRAVGGEDGIVLGK